MENTELASVAVGFLDAKKPADLLTSLVERGEDPLVVMMPRCDIFSLDPTPFPQTCNSPFPDPWHSGTRAGAAPYTSTDQGKGPESSAEQLIRPMGRVLGTDRLSAVRQPGLGLPSQRERNTGDVCHVCNRQTLDVRRVPTPSTPWRLVSLALTLTHAPLGPILFCRSSVPSAP